MNQYSKVRTISNFGLNSYTVDVETHIANGLPSFKIIGLPDKTVSEAKERVSAAIKCSGYTFPLKRITVNLGPSEIPKHGTHFDLAIACSILIASRQVIPVQNEYLLCGELGLNGSIRSTPILSILINQTKHSQKIIISNKFKGSYNKDNKILVSPNLKNCCQFISGKCKLKILNIANLGNNKNEIKSIPQLQVSNSVARFITICLGGRHHANLVGIPGSGKTILSHLMAELQPALTHKDHTELEQIYSLTKYSTVNKAPFRNPHHTSTLSSILGGGTIPKPGEISLAHKGILFLDEIPLFGSNILNALRYPLDFQNICIARNSIKSIFPADFQLISAMNPCPCGYLDSKIKECKCSPNEISKYLKRIPEPFWNRVDINFTLEPKYISNINRNKSNNKIAKIQQRISEIIEKQKRRGLKNSKLELKDINKVCTLTPKAQDLLNLYLQKQKISARNIIKITRIAQTISDLESHNKITENDIAEATSYRNKTDYLLEN